MYPRTRLDGLSDAIFGVAMTLLVLDLRIPEGIIEPKTAGDLLAVLGGLAPKFWPFVLSFVVLGGRWRDMVRDRAVHHEVGEAYSRFWMFYLLTIALLPFSSMVLGRYADLAPSEWLYAGNLVAMSLLAHGMAMTGPPEERAKVSADRVGVVILLISAIAVVAWSFVHPARSSLAYLLNMLTPSVERLLAMRKAKAAAKRGK